MKHLKNHLSRENQNESTKIFFGSFDLLKVNMQELCLFVFTLSKNSEDKHSIKTLD